MKTFFAIYLVLPLIVAGVLPILSRMMGRRVGWVAFGAALITAMGIVSLIPEATNATEIVWPWVPSLGLSLTFLVDGLAVFYGCVVAVMGVLILFYACFYMDDAQSDHGRFYAYLLFFEFAMLGTVFAGNLLLLFIFWELTGIASFLLIGFKYKSETSRKGARMALVVTGATGLVMLVGIVLLYLLGGTWNLKELMASPPDAALDMMNVAMLLTMIGAFGKSAQFPFQFWLPNAMAAPTPVSAYLHSATMVKLGVFLCGRLFPVFHETEYWMPLLTTLAFGTMLFAAVLALLATDLKGILAWSTVCQLGFLVGYYGMAPPEGVDFDYLHIINHVFYKGSLFMIAGIVDHACGTRDIRLISGLWRRMPILGTLCLIACMSMAGIPGTTGFISKEYILKEIYYSFGDHGVLGAYALILIMLMSFLKVAFSARFFHGIFMDNESKTVSENFHRPDRKMYIPPMILMSLTIIFGLYPPALDHLLSAFNTASLHNLTRGELHLWHGVTKELITSIVLTIGGIAFYAAIFKWKRNDHRIPFVLEFDRAFTRGLDGLIRRAKKLTRILQADNPLAYLPILIGFTVVVVGGTALRNFETLPMGGGEITPNLLRSLTAFLIAVGVIGTVTLSRWTAQLISLSVAGFLICYYYVLYRAPNLALTQMLVETVTLVLVLLLLNRFPRSSGRGDQMVRPTGAQRFLNLTISIGMGLLMTTLVLSFSSTQKVKHVGERVLEQTVPLAKGSNAVNTILVDFRGLDTLGEIAVLLITLLGCLGLLTRHKRTREEYLRGSSGPAGFGIDHSDQEGAS